MSEEGERHKKLEKRIQRYAAIYGDGHLIRRAVDSTVKGRLGYMLRILNTE